MSHVVIKAVVSRTSIIVDIPLMGHMHVSTLFLSTKHSETTAALVLEYVPPALLASF